MPSMTLLSSPSTSHRPHRPSNTIASTAQPLAPVATSAVQTASVFNYTCLFTHDVRRKNTKRWLDGRLSLHSFNNRVMVYDESRNYIGDTFNKEGDGLPLQDGDELMLDRVGVLVQVGERKETQQTDLRELLAKRAPKSIGSDKSQNFGTTAQVLVPQIRTSQVQAQRKWTGWGARAQVQTDSPHELRRVEATQKENKPCSEPPRKRQRQDDEHVPLWQILKTSRPDRMQCTPTSILPVAQQAQTPQAARQKSKAPKRQLVSSAIKRPRGDQGILKVKEVIDITGDTSETMEPDHEQRSVSVHEEVEEPYINIADMSHITVSGASPRSAQLPHSGPLGSRMWNSPLVKTRSLTKSPTRSKAPIAPGSPKEDTSSKLRDVPFVDIDHLIAPDDRLRKVAKQGTAHSSSDLSSKKTTSLEKQDSEYTRHRKKTPIRRRVANQASRPPEKVAKQYHETTCDRQSSPPVSTTSLLTGADLQEVTTNETYHSSLKSDKAVTKKHATKPLRLASTAPKQTLLFCQTLGAPSAKQSAVIEEEEIKTATRKCANVKRNLQQSIPTTDTTAEPREKLQEVIMVEDDDSQCAFESMPSPKSRHNKQQMRNGIGIEEISNRSLELGRAKQSPVAQDHFDLESAVAPEDLLESFANDSKAPNTLQYGTARLDAQLLMKAYPAIMKPVSASSTIDLAQGNSTGDEARSSTRALFEAAPSTKSLQADLSTIMAALTRPDSVRQTSSKTSVNLGDPAPLKRPYRRVASDTSPNRTHVTRKPVMQRAETISIPEEVRRESVGRGATETQAGQQREREDREREEKEKGPWSREAFDLFGGVPAGREAGVVWCYDVHIDSGAG